MKACASFQGAHWHSWQIHAGCWQVLQFLSTWAFLQGCLGVPVAEKANQEMEKGSCNACYDPVLKVIYHLSGILLPHRSAPFQFGKRLNKGLITEMWNLGVILNAGYYTSLYPLCFHQLQRSPLRCSFTKATQREGAEKITFRRFGGSAGCEHSLLLNKNHRGGWKM